MLFSNNALRDGSMYFAENVRCVYYYSVKKKMKKKIFCRVTSLSKIKDRVYGNGNIEFSKNQSPVLPSNSSLFSVVVVYGRYGMRLYTV